MHFITYRSWTWTKQLRFLASSKIHRAHVPTPDITQMKRNQLWGLFPDQSWLDGDIQMHLPVGALIGCALALVLPDLVVDVARGDAPQGQPVGVRVRAAEIPQSPPQISCSPHIPGGKLSWVVHANEAIARLFVASNWILEQTTHNQGSVRNGSAFVYFLITFFVIPYKIVYASSLDNTH